MSRPSRREFLRVSAVGIGMSVGVSGVMPRRAHALGESPVGIARLLIDGLEDPHPGAIAALLAEVEANSSVKPDLTPREVDPASAALFDQPFVRKPSCHTLNDRHPVART